MERSSTGLGRHYLAVSHRRPRANATRRRCCGRVRRRLCRVPAGRPMYGRARGPRTVTIGAYEAELARAAQTDPAWRADYRATRPKVERKIGYRMRPPRPRSRYHQSCRRLLPACRRGQPDPARRARTTSSGGPRMAGHACVAANTLLDNIFGQVRNRPIAEPTLRHPQLRSHSGATAAPSTATP